MDHLQTVNQQQCRCNLLGDVRSGMWWELPVASERIGDRQGLCWVLNVLIERLSEGLKDKT